jgi:hypothetical protein
MIALFVMAIAALVGILIAAAFAGKRAFLAAALIPWLLLLAWQFIYEFVLSPKPVNVEGLFTVQVILGSAVAIVSLATYSFCRKYFNRKVESAI